VSKSKPAPPDCGGAISAPPASAPPGSVPGTGGTTPESPGSASGTAVTPPCPVETEEVDETVTETITNGDPRWNGTYDWDSKYLLTTDRANCTVKVTMKLKVTGTITEAQKAAWKSAIESKWNGKAYLCCTDCNCPRGLPITVEVQYVDSGEHYTITAQTPGATEGGRAGLGGTTSMTGWGVDDTVDVTHEFGHMLGNPEEYYTTNGIDYTEGGTKLPTRDPSGGIMNNPANNPLPRNYEPIKAQAEDSMGNSCSVRGTS